METNDYNGFCICMHCNTRIPHVKGVPCRENDCPQCGKKMIREDGYHHQLYKLKNGEKNDETCSSNQGKCC